MWWLPLVRSSVEAKGFDEPLGIVEADVRCVSLLETGKQFRRTHEAS
jgi:hypothetical protein